MQKTTTCDRQEDYEYALEVKEFYTVNRTYQSYRWKEIALGKTRKDLEVFMVGRNIRNTRIVKR